MAGLLALAVLALLLARWVLSSGNDQGAIAGDLPADVATGIRDSLDALLVRSDVDLKTVRTWRVYGRAGKMFRIEQRVPVPAGFATLQFNHDLNRSLASVGARVVATERTKQKTVTMHIIRDGVTVRSTMLVLNPSL